MLNIFLRFFKKEKEIWVFFLLKNVDSNGIYVLVYESLIALVSKFHFCFVIKNADRKSQEFAQKNCSNWFFFPQLSYKYLNVPWYMHFGEHICLFQVLVINDVK